MCSSSNLPTQPPSIMALTMAAPLTTYDYDVPSSAHLIEPEDQEQVAPATPPRVIKSLNDNKALSASCHSARSYGYGNSSKQTPKSPRRQMRRLSFGNCTTTVEFDRKMPVSECLLHEYDSPTSSTHCRWEAETMVTSKAASPPKRNRPRWAENVVAQLMPKMPARAFATDQAPTIPALLRREEEL
jgi:hypothetical protein